ncbi:biopolymer transporter ExbD [Herbaspirillum sp. RTI4]|uniref:ExbD/TolR family protein n=1 Tax=Herbaspirillum sp. RTI4 TaxID=3048640 RepID=UPI002AB510E2|nr:biopolymer transporter ExbD [Herbaspirillum sp. RTI4]MDY7576780.1 biopolymer transporter ExbD [Herbaspirillum sp. RTI4]MEA9981376.1 biopolymer transporter ExbD [Herbaspirillum sp. RTI4]
MAMGSLSDADDDFNPEINTTPLVDVMLVLLIIFIMTIPVMNHAVKIDLPRATNQPDQTKPENINLSIDAQGKTYWNEELVDAGQLEQRIAVAAQKQPAPELHLRAERSTEYEKIAQVMAAAQSGGLSKIGFVTEPKK